MVSTMVSGFGAILFLPFALAESRHFAFEEVSLAEWGLVLYFGIVIMVIAFILMQQGVAKVSATMAGICTSFLPISSIVSSSVFLGEEITLMHFVGFAFILGALYYLPRQPV